MTNLPPVIKIVPMPGPQGPSGTGNANTGSITFNNVDIIGAGNASGDGYGFSTINLVPDASLKANNQYLIIDPTAPNHIHIRAGGAQDDSSAVLIFGGERANVTVSDYNHQVSIQSYNSTGDYGHYWNFGNDGILYGPAMGSLIVNGISGAANQDLNLYASSDKDITIYNNSVAGVPVGYRYPAIKPVSFLESIDASLSDIGRTLWNDHFEAGIFYVVPTDAILDFPLGTEIKFACGTISAFLITSEDNSIVQFIGEGTNYQHTLTGLDFFVIPPDRIATLTKLAPNRWILSGLGVTD